MVMVMIIIIDSIMGIWESIMIMFVGCIFTHSNSCIAYPTDTLI